MAFFLPSGAHRINKFIGSEVAFQSLNIILRCVVVSTPHLFIAPMTQNTDFSGSFVLPLSLRTSAHTGVAIRNTHWEEADSHGHKCPLNDSFVGRHAKSNTPINRNLKSGNNRIKKQKTALRLQHRYQLLGSDSPLNLVRTEASGTSIHMAGSTVNDGLDPLYIGLPGSVGTSVGVGNLDTECNALATIITLRHSLHLQSEIVNLSTPKQALRYDNRHC